MRARMGWVIGVLIVLVLAWGQGPAGAAEDVVTIEVGTTAVPPRALKWFEREIESFRKAHPNIRVETIALSSPMRPEDALIENLPRLAENVIGIVGDNNHEASYLASRELVVPIEKFLPDPEFSLDVFDDNHWSIVTYDGKIWGIPWCVNWACLLLDWPLFEAAGINEPPRTWDEFFDYARRLTKDTDGDGEIDQWGFQYLSRFLADSYLFKTMNLQQAYLNAEGDLGARVSRPYVKQNFERLYDFLHSEYVKSDQSLRWLGNQDNKYPCAMRVCYNQGANKDITLDLIQDIGRAGRRIRFAFLPTFGPKVMPAVDERFLAVRRSTPEKEAASWKFVKWINRKDITLGGQSDLWFAWPARKDYRDPAEVVSRAFGDDVNIDRDIMIQAAAWTRAVPQNSFEFAIPQGGRARPNDDSLSLLLKDLFSGKTTYDEAIAYIVENDLLVQPEESAPQPQKSYELFK